MSLKQELKGVKSKVNREAVKFNDFLLENAFATISTAIEGGVRLYQIDLASPGLKAKILRYSKFALTYPDGSNPTVIELKVATLPAGYQTIYLYVSGQDAWEQDIFPAFGYPVGSLISGLDYEANSILAAAGGEDATGGDVQYYFGGFLTGSSSPAPLGSLYDFKFNPASGVVTAEGFSGDGSALTNLPATNSSGASGDVQYNDGSNGFAGESDFNYDDTTNILSVPSIDASGDISANTFSGNGANLTGLPASGSNTHVQFNDVGSLSGYSTFTFNKYNGNLNAPRFLGENISGSVYQDSSGYSAMYLTPDDFRPTNNTSYSGFISNNGGRMGWGSTSYSHYATFQVPKGYKVTGVDLKGSANYSFFLYASTWSSGTATYKATGTINTALTLLSYQQLIGNSGDYFTIRFQPSSYGNYIYGCKLLLYPT